MRIVYEEDSYLMRISHFLYSLFFFDSFLFNSTPSPTSFYWCSYLYPNSQLPWCFSPQLHQNQAIHSVSLGTLVPIDASKFLLAIELIQFITEKLMSPQSTLNPSRALEGVRGVHVVPHSPFALEEATKDGDFPQSNSRSSAIEVNQRLLMQWVWQHRPACLRPIQGCIQGDQHLAETVTNVLTSLPFIALGIQAPRKNVNTKLYANSLIGVGVVSSLYHSSRGKLRQYLRWADYTMIATATVCLSRALRDDNPKLLTAASAFFLPVQPLMVSAVHTGMMEVVFAQRASQDPDLRMAYNVHKMSSLLSGVLFIADDVFPRTPFIHAAWHLTAAVGVSTCNKLLE